MAQRYKVDWRLREKLVAPKTERRGIDPTMKEPKLTVVFDGVANGEDKFYWSRVLEGPIAEEGL